MARVEAAQVGAIAGLLIGACFVKPDGPSGIDPDAGTSDDGSLDGMAPCPLRDNFDPGGPLCGSWGSNESTGSHNANRDGELLFFATGSGGTGACQSIVEVPFTSVVVQISGIVEEAKARTGVTLSFDDGETFTLDIASSGATASVFVMNGINEMIPIGGYSGTAHQYFRFRKEGPSDIEMSFSSDGTSWPTSATYNTQSTLGRVKVRLYAWFGPNVMTFKRATFDNLDGCAP